MTVREVLRRLRADAWVRVESRGGHRRSERPSKRGRVTVSGHPPDLVPPKTLASVFRQAGWSD